MREAVARLVREPDDVRRIERWLAVNDDILGRFPVNGTSPGKDGPSVMLPAPNPDVEQRMMARYGSGTTFNYGTAYAPISLFSDSPEAEH